MNTPSHAIINLAIFSHLPLPQANLAILFGSILPDLPIFGFYVWAKYLRQMPSTEIWSDTYFQPGWQNLFHSFHSFPLIFIGWLISYVCGWQIAQVIFISAFLHCVFDFPVHNDDAHRHFFPLTDYRFISPISYWDSKHYGAIGALIELICVLCSTLRIFPIVESWVAKGLLLSVNGFYVSIYVYFYLRAKLWFS